MGGRCGGGGGGAGGGACMKLGKYIKDRLYSVCIFAAMLIISVLMMAAFKVSVQLIIAEIFIMII